MLGFFPQIGHDCQAHNRRDFLLQLGTLSGLGLSLDAFLQQSAMAQSQPRQERSCILIWTRGGTSHHDTLDPKPDAQPIASIRPDLLFKNRLGQSHHPDDMKHRGRP